MRVGVRIRTLKTTELSRRGGFLLLNSFFVLTARKDLGTITSDSFQRYVRSLDSHQYIFGETLSQQLWCACVLGQERTNQNAHLVALHKVG